LLNARSLCNKIADLHECIDRLQPSFIFISETWFTNDISDAMVVPADKYHIVRTDRVGKRAGGVCALISKYFNIVQVPSDPTVEIVAFDVVVGNECTFRFIVCYRPPYYDITAQNYLTAFISCLVNLCDINYTLFIVGDFNMPDVCWPDFSFNGKHAAFSNAILDFVCDQGLSQCVMVPTRGDNLLDLVFTNDPLLVNDCVADAPFIDCDHLSIRFNILLPVAAVPDYPTSQIVEGEPDVLCYFNYEAADYDNLNAYFLAVNWLEVFSDVTDINKCWDSFIAIVNQGIELFVPIKVCKYSLSRKQKKTFAAVYTTVV